MTDASQKAEKIIERFGGIRPMAAKMGVPVTTVQGWKKRDAIPDNRIDDILAAARSHEIDVSDLIASNDVEELVAAKQTNEQAAEPENSDENSDFEELKPAVFGVEDEDESGDDLPDVLKEDRPIPPVAFSTSPQAKPEQKAYRPQSTDGPGLGGAPRPSPSVREAEVRAIKTSSLISIIFILLIAMLSATYLWPMLREHNERITHVESQVEGLRDDITNEQKEAESASMTWSERLAEIERQAQEAKKIAESSMKSAAHEVSKAQQEIMRDGVAGAYKKAKEFDQYVTDMTAKSPALQGFVDTLDSILDEKKGRETINNAATALSSAFTSGSGEAQESAEDAIERARKTDPSAAAVFDGVPKEDLKAAGVMLSLSQLRDSLSQEGKPFDQDLELLKNMVGEDDPKLRRAIEEAEPKAKEGVFSPSALSQMFDSVSGKVVDKSLEGEDVSLTEQASAKFNSLFQVEKDGELVTGTSTQATLNKAKNLLAQGDVRGARAVIDTLPPDEKAQLKDWIDQADATIQIQNLSATLDSSLSSITGIDDFLSGYYITRQGKSLSVR